MTKLLVITHGKMAMGIKDSVDLIIGNSDNIITESLVAGQDFEEFKSSIESKIRRGGKEEPVLVMVDLFSASPYNASLYLSQKLREEGYKIEVITGVNLPMVLEASLMADSMELEELKDLAVKNGREGVIDAIALLDSSLEDEEEDY
mgnify:FL=1